MLNGNQYLRPEYLSPLPTTLDTKKSPLALLAQTCNSIGANIGSDNPNNKHVVSGLEKTKDSSSDLKKDKSPVIISDDHSNSNKPSFKPYESVIKKDDAFSNEFNGKKTPNSKTSTPLSANHISPAVSTGSCGKSSPATSENGRSSSSHKQSATTPTSVVSSSTADATITTLSSSQNTLSGLGYGSPTGLDLSRSDPKDGFSQLGLSAYKALSLNPLSNCNGCPPLSGAGIDGHAFQGMAQSSLLKANNFALSAGMSPYLGYARLRTASGGHTFVPVCRDPSCTNCQFSVHNAQLSPCPSGCTQCTHDRLGSVPGLGHGLIPGMNSSVAAMAAAAAGMSGLAYPPAVLPRPNVCSWMIGDTCCGKRFSTSEELLQHVKTHATLPTSESSLSLLSPSYSLSSSNLSAAACHMHYTSPTSLTSAGLRRTYPTSLSPVSSLSAASRFHPYKPSMIPGAPLPQLAHPGLGVYYPYSLYGQRLGPPVHP